MNLESPHVLQPVPRALASSPQRQSAPQATLLGRFPGVARQLTERGVALQPDPGEGMLAYENRLATALMALHRDTRSNASFEALYALTRSTVEAWIRSLLARTGSTQDPGDVLQDTFVNVYRYPSGFRDEHPGSFRVWVRTIAGNLIRRGGGRAARPLQLAFPEEEAEPADRRHDPALLASREEQEGRLQGAYLLLLAHYHRAWSELSQRDRRALHLVEVEGLRYREAAEILRVGPSNMKMIVFRARKRIARRIRQAMNAAVVVPSDRPAPLRRAV